MTSIGRMDRDGAVTEYTEQGSTIRWRSFAIGQGDTPATILAACIRRLRYDNAGERDPARERALAITNAEQALHWLQALEDRRTSR